VYAHSQQRETDIYKAPDGKEPYTEFLNSIRDRKAVSKIRIRLTRAESGNLGKHRTVGQGVIELKIDYGPGYRVYVALFGSEWIIVLHAGDKSTQERDIRLAQDYWRYYRGPL